MQNEELRRTQAELDATRARYVELFDLAPVAYLTLSDKGLILEANFAAVTLLGVSRASMIGAPLSRYLLGDDQDVYYRHRRRLSAARGADACELRVVRSDDTIVWTRLSAVPTGDAEGTARVVLSDVTQLKRAEELLRTSEVRHRLLFENAHDGLIVVAPPNGSCRSCNPATVAMFGARSEEDFCSRELWRYAPSVQPDGRSSRAMALEMIRRAMVRGSHLGEWSAQRLSGEEFPTTVLLTKLRLEGHTLLSATVRDETDAKRQKALLAQRDRLASMGLLAASVAHEINNPLSFVSSNIEQLVQTLPEVAAAIAPATDSTPSPFASQPVAVRGLLEDAIERAREAAGGMARITALARALSTFARVESTRCSAIGLNEAITSAIAVGANALRHRARIVQELGAVPPVWASAGRLSQVFLDILINASEATAEGHAGRNTITIRTWADGGDAFAEVEDTGEGIPEHNLARVFEPFFTTRGGRAALGLGLSIGRSIIDDLGGEISIASHVGRGTRVLVRLPLAEHAAVEPASPASKASAPRLRGRILVIDDEPAIRAVLARMLGALYDVVTCASAEEAQALLTHDLRFDAIVSDLMMPGMSGAALHEWLSELCPALARRVVFITGGAFTPGASEYLTKIDNPTLDKPFDSAALARMVARFVAMAQRERES